MNKEFFRSLEKIIKESQIIIDRPKGTSHPNFPDLIYEIGYGYLENTKTVDGDGIDCWVGSLTTGKLNGIIIVVFSEKREVEIKLIYNCTEEEVDIIYRFHNQNQMKGILLRYES